MERPIASARFQLIGWWIAHVARTFGENVLRLWMLVLIFVPHQLRTADNSPAIGAALSLALISMLPTLLLAPLASKFVRQTQLRFLLLGSTLINVLAICMYLLRPNPETGLLAVALSAIGSMIYTTARCAAIPSIARQAEWPIAGVNAWFMITATVGFVTGALVAITKNNALTMAWIGMVVSFVALTPIRHCIPASESCRGMFKHFRTDLAALWKETEFRVVVLATVLFLPILLMLFTLAILLGTGLLATMKGVAFFAVGAILSLLQTHASRTRGWIPFGILLLIPFALFAWSTGNWAHPGVWICTGLVVVPMRSAFVIECETRPATGAGFFAILSIGITLTYLGLVSMLSPFQAASVLPWVIVSMLVVSFFVFSWLYLRSVLECIFELIFLYLHPIKGFGPGLHKMPQHGPVLYIANHAAWLDPLWMMKVIPGQVTPMMTSRFFDLPVLGWFMRNVVKAIRVPDMAFRREAPELKEAIAALKRGESVMIFPEGYLRRKEEQPLRRFGRGIWEILKVMPDVPIVACWVDGGWGSYTSFYNGPPTKNKKMDRGRPIRIGVNEPIVIDPKLLEDHLATRVHLMHHVAEARKHLGLPEITVPKAGDDEGKEEKGGAAE